MYQLWICIGINFTPILAEFYSDVNDKDQLLEIVYIPFDKTKEEYEDFRKAMPWLALPYDDPKKEALTKEYKIIGIPHLVVLKPDGTVVVPNGRADVQKKGLQAFEEWLAKAAS